MNEYTKLTLGGIIVLLLVSVGCYFWYHWTTAPDRQAYQETEQLLHDWTAPPAAVETAHGLAAEETSVTPVQNESVSAEKTTAKLGTSIEKSNSHPASGVASMITESVEVSPYGFGAYPEIPSSWPQDVVFFPAQTIEHELLLRVEIALTDQGVEVMGSTMENGRVYPTIKGRVYVRWTDDPRFGRYISEVGGHPETAMRFEMLLESFESESDRNFRVSDAPGDIEIVDYDDSGIDPYSFLGL